MKGFTRGITLAAVALAAMLPASRSHADTMERQLEKLRQMVIQLQEVVQQQGQTIRHQEQLMRELQQQIPPPEEMVRALEPHLDKHLLHERSGVGEQLGNLRIAVGLTGVVQGSIDGEDISGENRDQTDGSWSMDLELESPVGERGLAFMLIEAGQGDGLTDELEGLFHNVNDDAGDSESGLEVTEAWYEHLFFDERVVLTVGKLDLTNYFDASAVANDETTQFLNSGLVNSLAVEFPEDNGAGMRLGVYPAEWVEFGLGWAESDADWEDIANDGFGIAEVNLKPNFHEREGNYRFYAWANGSDKERLGNGDSHKNGWGVGLSFDQQLTDCLTAFLRAGYQDEDVYEVEGTWSAGAEIRGSKWNRENDVLGFAVSQALISNNVKPDDTETLFEAYYSIMFSEQFRLSPDIQIIDNPGGDADNDTVIVLGTRAQVDF